MLKKSIFLFLVVLAGCSNPTAPKEKTTSPDTHVKSTVSTAKPEANFWPVSSYALKKGETEARKFVKFVTEGNFSDRSQASNYIYAEVLVDKINAGIFLHKFKKSNPAEKFNDPVQIKMTNSSGQELRMTSTRSWNSSGGILVERNNNDYSQFRIFLLQSKGTVAVEISDSGSNVYRFSLNAGGFSESFSSL